MYAFAGEGTDRGFAARADAAHDNVHFLDSHGEGLLSQELAHFGCRERRARLAAGEAQARGRGPSEGVPRGEGEA